MWPPNAHARTHADDAHVPAIDPAGICAVRKAYDYSAFVSALPPPALALWHAVDALPFDGLPNYEALRATLAPQPPACCVHRGGAAAASVCGVKRAREEAAALSVAEEAVEALPAAVTGPEEPRGKRLRAAMAADVIGAMAREE